MKSWPSKDPDEVLDYELDWEPRLGDDTLATVTWTVPAGLTKTDEDISGAIAVLWLSGGTVGESYTIACRAVTAGGRTYDETLRLAVRSR